MRWVPGVPLPRLLGREGDPFPYPDYTNVCSFSRSRNIIQHLLSQQTHLVALLWVGSGPTWQFTRQPTPQKLEVGIHAWCSDRRAL